MHKQIITIIFLTALVPNCEFNDEALQDKNRCHSNFECPNNLICQDQICVPPNEFKHNSYDSGQEKISSDQDLETNKTDSTEKCSYEICDNLDNDCDGLIDEGFNVGKECFSGQGVCKSYGHFVCQSNNLSNCNAEPLDFRKTEEICDNFDNDCDGQTDEELNNCCRQNQERFCGTDIGKCKIGLQICLEFGIWSECTDTKPKEEICDNFDNDCDGYTDELLDNCCQLNDTRECGTDIGECQKGEQSCSEIRHWSECNDKKPTLELCDNKDNDCDGLTDEELDYCCRLDETKLCGISDIGQCQTFLQTCDQNFRWTTCEAIYPNNEICDNLDNDCDSGTDENNPCPHGLCQNGQCIIPNCQITIYQNHTYGFCNQELVWLEASMYCRQYEGNLATINDQQENNFLSQPQFAYQAIWIGLNDLAAENTWTWVSGENSGIYEWAWGEPNNTSGIGTGEEDCVEISRDSPFNGGWNDAFCGLSRPFFCEWNELF